MGDHPFVLFLEDFIPRLESKSRQLNKLAWVLETTGSLDAAEVKAELDAELKILFSDSKIYQKLLAWDLDSSLVDPKLKRQLNVLIRAFKGNQIPEELISEISRQESSLLYTYANFRTQFEGVELSENAIRQKMKEETNPEVRRKIWEASKGIGSLLAPKVLELVKLRNKAAQSLGYSDYFSMQLDLQEVKEEALFFLLEELETLSESSYVQVLEEIGKNQAARFLVPASEAIAPWAWSEPFCQEDPIESKELDSLVSSLDLVEVSKAFYDKMGVDVSKILEQSDLFEKPGKNQHAFCINIDRKSDVRTLNNVKPNMKWLETLLHELGHAIYELGFDQDLPWLLREPPHMITTEAMALIAGRRAYLKEVLCYLPSYTKEQESLIKKAEDSLRRRQLIFSRWVLVMTYFERELYRNPAQDLNALWWKMVHRYQKIPIPLNREGKGDWASKYHIGLAPVYYYSYLLGELFASSIEEVLGGDLGSLKAGELLRTKLFSPGNSLPWDALIEHVTGYPLSSKAWIEQFAFDVN